MTVHYDGALWTPLPEANRQGVIVGTQAILHTVVGRPNPFAYFARDDVRAESHLWFPMWSDDGPPRQMMDMARAADANYRANRRPDGTGALSAETQDDGTPEDNPATPEDEATPWTEYQLDQLARWWAWCNDPDGYAGAYEQDQGRAIAPIPLVLCAHPDAPGVGWHSMFPMVWTNVRGKTCPGRPRIAQVPSVLERALDYRTPAHYPPLQPPGETMYAVRNTQSQELRIVADKAGMGPPGLTWDAFQELERTGVITAPPNPDASDNASGNVAGTRWQNLSPEAFGALPGA